MMAAVTLDLWNTLVLEGPGGLFMPRVRRWGEVLRSEGIHVEEAALLAAHQTALDSYQRSWLAGRQFRSREATAAVLSELGLRADRSLRDRLEESFRVAGAMSDVEASPHARDALESIHSTGIRTAIICDIGLTPSSALVGHLERLGLRPFIDVLAWSDERGCYKPDPAIFAWTLEALGVRAEDALHVGDRLRTDVSGGRAAGMTTARFRAIYDDPDDLAEADHVLDDLMQLLPVLGVSSDHPR